MTALSTAGRTLRLGTRRSTLAVTQSRWVAEALGRAGGASVDLVEISTLGDRSSAAVAELGGTGVFVTGLREQLLSGAVDFVVHSLKDLPTTPAAGLQVAAIPRREDPRDALVDRAGRTLGELPPGARVGTGSPRRQAQLLALGQGLEVVAIRGNVDTRLRRVADGEVDAVVLARAGLARLGRIAEITEVLDPLQVLPAPGQGALAVECRAGDERLADLLGRLDDLDTRAAVTAERSLLGHLESGCTAPVGALADVAEGDAAEPEIYLRAAVLAPDGSRALRLSATGPASAAIEVGRRLAADLLAAGAADLMENR